MSVARLAEVALPQPQLARAALVHVLPRVQAEVARELQPLARRVIERRKLERDEQPRCVMAVGCALPEELSVLRDEADGCGSKCLTLRAGLVLPTCSWHYRAWLRLVGVEWAARALGLVPFAGDLNRPDGVALYWPQSPCRSPRLYSRGEGERIELTAEQAHVLADAIADLGRRDCADMVRHLADWATSIDSWRRPPAPATMPSCAASRSPTSPARACSSSSGGPR